MEAPVRLPSKAVAIIRQHVTAADPKACVYIIGSRADLTKKGGDIDILIISAAFSVTQRQRLLFALEDFLGEQKIDILVFQNDLSSFVQFALPTAVKL